MRQSSEVDEIAHVHAESVGDAAKQVDANVGRALFDLPKMGLIGVNHERKLPLRQPLGFAETSNVTSKSYFALIYIHAKRLYAIVPKLTCYSKSIIELARLLHSAEKYTWEVFF